MFAPKRIDNFGRVFQRGRTGSAKHLMSKSPNPIFPMKLSSSFLCFSLLVLPFLPSVGKAQEVVRYEPVALSFWTSDNLSLSLSRQGDGYLLTLQLRATDRRFLPESTLWLRTFEDQMIQLSGKLIDNEVQLSVKDEGVAGYPKRRVVATAVYPITREQLAQLNRGVKQLRLSTIPMTYDVRFDRDRIGKALYNLFLAQEEVM